MTAQTNIKRPLLLAVLAAIGASACCVGPLLLLTLGIGGAWVGNLTAMTPYSPYFTGVTVIILLAVFWQLYIKPKKDCAKGQLCANPKVLYNQRIIFWLVSACLLAMITFPYYAEYILD